MSLVDDFRKEQHTTDAKLRESIEMLEREGFHFLSVFCPFGI